MSVVVWLFMHWHSILQIHYGWAKPLLWSLFHLIFVLFVKLNLFKVWLKWSISIPLNLFFMKHVSIMYPRFKENEGSFFPNLSFFTNKYWINSEKRLERKAGCWSLSLHPIFRPLWNVLAYPLELLISRVCCFACKTHLIMLCNKNRMDNCKKSNGVPWKILRGNIGQKYDRIIHRKDWKSNVSRLFFISLSVSSFINLFYHENLPNYLFLTLNVIYCVGSLS